MAESTITAKGETTVPAGIRVRNDAKPQHAAGRVGDA